MKVHVVTWTTREDFHIRDDDPRDGSPPIDDPYFSYVLSEVTDERLAALKSLVEGEVAEGYMQNTVLDGAVWTAAESATEWGQRYETVHTFDFPEGHPSYDEGEYPLAVITVVPCELDEIEPPVR